MSEQVQQGSLSARVAEEVRVALARQRRPQRSLADDLGVSPMWVNDRVNCVKDIGLNDLERMAKALGVPVGELIPADVTAPVAGAA
jgi:transcriptional regulator with XRE-family HTH domain